MDESQAAQQVQQNVVENVDLSGIEQAIEGLAGDLGGLSTMIQTQNDNVNTLISGLVTVQMFSLLAQLLTLGVVLVVVFVVAMRRF